MEKDVFVVQIIADGDRGFPDDEVVQIGICAVDLRNEEVESSYFQTIRIDDMPPDKKDFIGKTDVTEYDVSRRISTECAAAEVKGLLAGSEVTSFDISNVFNRYMIYEPWDLTHEVTILPSVRSRLPHNLHSPDHSMENQMIVASYDSIFPDDAFAIGDGRTALDLALRTSYILIALRKNELY